MGYAGGLVLVSGEDARILQTAGHLAKAHQLNLLGILQKPVLPDQLRKLMDGSLSSAVARHSPAPRRYGPDELQRAIAGGELQNYYQPKVSLTSGAVIGVESLVRWQHPTDGMVFPDQFIATAEANNLIDDLTNEVLAIALRQCRLWQNAGLDLQVAVNISMDNLSAVEFPDIVMRAVAAAGVSATSLTLEVTESQLMVDTLAPLDILTRLRLKRIGLSIDDFGTGYSSLAQLRDAPFDELKVDKGFVNGACRAPSLRAIVEASLSMARQLEMRTVAEGVEDRDDWDYLRAIGCDVAQGYFIAKPMPGEHLSGWIRSWEARRADLLDSPLSLR